MNTRENILPFIFVLLFSLNCYSQSDSDTDTSKEDYNQAIQFYILDEVIAGYKYHFTENSAVRLIINATGLFIDKDADNIELRENYSDTLRNYISWSTVMSNQFFEIKLEYLHHYKIHNSFQLFFGGGPLINYTNYRYEDWYEDYNPSSGQRLSGSSISTENIWNIGVSVLIGLECVVYNNVSLFAEYEAAISYGWQNTYSNTSSIYVSSDKNNIDILSYELKGLRIGAGIYF